MYGILAALVSGAIVAAALKLGAGLSTGYTIFTGVIVAAIVYIILFRVITKKVTAGMEIVQR
ncbi:MAG: hypothetical protein GWN87_16030, partial [Desulfuromonadales bacterium]|nr:hypothetical protein [Desulfuromonadales bacterium]